MINPYSPPQDDGVAPAAALPPGDASGDVLEMTFDLTEADLVTFHLDHVKRTNSSGSQAVRVLGIPMVLVPLPALLDGDFSASPITLLLFGVLFLALSFWLGSRRQITKAVHTAVATQGRIGDLDRWVAVVAPTGATFTTSTRRSEFTWQAFHAVEESAEQVLLYTNPMTAFIIPKRAADPRLLEDARHYLAVDRQQRNDVEVVTAASTLRKPHVTLALWLVLIVIFLAIWTLLSPGG